jgi:hypothetical protein
MKSGHNQIALPEKCTGNDPMSSDGILAKTLPG